VQVDQTAILPAIVRSLKAKPGAPRYNRHRQEFLAVPVSFASLQGSFSVLQH
jgi:hypothetical protein